MWYEFSGPYRLKSSLTSCGILDGYRVNAKRGLISCDFKIIVKKFWNQNNRRENLNLKRKKDSAVFMKVLGNILCFPFSKHTVSRTIYNIGPSFVLLWNRLFFRLKIQTHVRFPRQASLNSFLVYAFTNSYKKVNNPKQKLILKKTKSQGLEIDGKRRNFLMWKHSRVDDEKKMRQSFVRPWLSVSVGIKRDLDAQRHSSFIV